MNASFFLFGILPLLVFVIIDSFAGLKAGLIAGILFAVADVVYSLVAYGTIDELTLASTALILICGLMSYKSERDIYFKLQPVVVGVIFGLAFLIMQAIGKPLLNSALEKYQLVLPEDMRHVALAPSNLKLFARLSGVLGFGFLVHAGLVAFAAFRMSKWWWLLIRGIGLYVMLIACTLLVRFS